jgi:hypothetical protein
MSQHNSNHQNTEPIQEEYQREKLLQLILNIKILILMVNPQSNLNSQIEVFYRILQNMVMGIGLDMLNMVRKNTREKKENIISYLE